MNPIIYCFFLLFVLPVFCDAQSYQDTVFTDYFRHNESGWIASDGTISLELPDGNTMWFMGDSHVDQIINDEGEIPCLFNTRSCILIQNKHNPYDIETYYDSLGTNVYERQFVKMAGDSAVTYWPADAVIHQDTVFSFWLRYIPDSNAPLGISFESMVVAKIKLPEMELLDVIPVQYPGWEYGMSLVWSEQDQSYYIYGKYLDWVIFKPILARCEYHQLSGEWEFFDGDGWSSNVVDAIPIADEASAAYSVFYLNNQYHLFYQENGFLQCGLGRDMYIYSADDPWGPFEEKKLVYTMEDQFYGVYPVTYNGEAHPHLIQDGELLISYNVNRICPDSCQYAPFTNTYNPDMYRPKFARVALCSFANDITPPVLMCLSNMVVDADSSGTYTINGTEFDPVLVFDNCALKSVSNNLNNLNSLEDFKLPSGTTEIIWTAVDSSNNERQCSFEVFVNEISTILPEHHDRGLIIFPNPAEDYLYIRGRNDVPLSVSIFRLNGQHLNLEVDDDGFIDLSELERGLCFLQVRLTDSVVTKKLLLR